MKGKFILVIISAIIISLGTHGHAICADKPQEPERTIVLSTMIPESLSSFHEMSSIYTEAFKRLGYHFKLVFLPGERAIVDANSGVVDGEAARIASLNSNKYPNVIRVEEPIIVTKEAAYSVDTSIKINGWESLMGKGYKVGLIKGLKLVEEKLSQYVEKENIVTLINLEQCLKMLQSRRIDLLIVGVVVEESELMKSDAYQDIKRVGIVQEKAVYPWLHKRHKALVSPLADTLKAMKADGTFQKLSEAAKLK